MTTLTSFDHYLVKFNRRLFLPVYPTPIDCIRFMTASRLYEMRMRNTCLITMVYNRYFYALLNDVALVARFQKDHESLCESLCPDKILNRSADPRDSYHIIVMTFLNNVKLKIVI